ncbi:class I SAM-dependent methyltransferase [Xanthobacteraceae bacterium Astr-EGSB]|uniref:class I SAM-dependent methyltransferase n=1 Tax=Astrobacterium formosum TaxID=3069710 RepID=UPI0027B29419|nr:class I SAM-dependent methyltransferase [Xanthobacteraceae bacterium Astr-EGSB]
MAAPQNVYDDRDFFAGYEQLRRTGTGLNDVLEQPALWSMLPASLKGLRVLDLGCGFGDFARRAMYAGARNVVGVDISERMLADARAQTCDAHITYRRMAIEELALEPNAFDLVVSSLALHYVADYAGALARVAAVLTAGGRFVFSVEHPMCTALPQQAWVRDADGRPLHWPVDDYRTEGPRRTRWFIDDVVKYHRTVETYVNGLLASGFSLRSLREPEPVAGETPVQIPGLDLARRRPPFLLIAADRLGVPGAI